ncbi:MAG: hypothetical protein NTZ95_04030 [Candidatus Omnitrophica bacterium]|nr:hypothetical protein [Candidatus Omnitrophota bacterium]
MMLIFEPDPPFIRWCTIENGHLSQNKVIFDTPCLDKIGRKVLKIIDEKNIVFGYLLSNGGDQINRPISLLTDESLMRVGKCIELLPEHNNIIYKAANYLSKKFANSQHVLFCDSSFFIDLPKKASTYAIPYKLRKKGIRRYGGYGLCHQWAWEEARRVFGKDIQKVISVYLGNTPNVAAIKNGVPVETTIGFTSVEGIPSINACGDIDPTIIFQLHAEGISFERINNLLSKESGLSCLFNKAPEILRYNVVRYIGAFISVLEGVDAIIFIVENVEDTKKIISGICHLLDFLGFKSKMKTRKVKGKIILSRSNSKIKGLCLHYDKWRVLSEKAISLTGKET